MRKIIEMSGASSLSHDECLGGVLKGIPRLAGHVFLRSAFMAALYITVAGLSFSAFAEDSKTEWASLLIVDVEEFPWDEHPRFGSMSKTFFRGPDTGSFVYAHWAPSWDTELPPDPLGSHYHHWSEWAYMLDGDFLIQEPVNPYQQNGVRNRFTEGTWLDRPAYSLHGGSWATGGARAQNSGTLIIYEEGDGSVVTVGPKSDHFKPDFPDKPVPYDPNWQVVEQFTRPWIVDTVAGLEWETDTEVAGRLVKWLSDDQKAGFRAQLIKIPPGWTAPQGAPKTYFRKANRMRFVVYGNMRVWSFDAPESAGKMTKVSKDFFIYQPAGSIWGYGKGPVSEHGAVWLEVTYASGVAHGGGKIEEATEIP